MASGGATIQQPNNGATVSGLVAVALAIDPRVSNANIYVDGALYASSVASNLTWDSSTVSDGSHVISVKSFSNVGRFLGGQAVMLAVQNGNPTSTPTMTPTPTPIGEPTPTITSTPTVVPTPPPSPTPVSTPTPVVITAPSNGATVEGTITFAAIKSSNCQWINFYVDGTYIASSPPSSILWDSTSVPDGAHTLSVNGYDSSDNLLASPAVSVIVNNAPGTPTPTTTPTATPTGKATSTGGAPTPTPSASPTVIVDPLRPSNEIPNVYLPTATELSTFHSGTGACGGLDDCSYMNNVDGQFTGTTSEIIQQIADKWCPGCTILNPLDGETYSFADLLRAIAVNETNWYEWRPANLSSPDPITDTTTLTPSHGDLEHVTQSQPDGGSWGLFQIAEGADQGWPASFPLSAESTAFNADFKTAEQMGVEQGHLSYLADPSRSQTAIANGYPPYVNYTDSNGVLHPASTDVNVLRWGAVGNWYSGGWYDSGAIQYIGQVQQYLHDQPWTQPGF